MTGRGRSARAAHQLHEGIACINRRGIGAGLIGAAGAVHFPGSDTGDPKVRAFRTLDRAIAIPDMGWRARKGLAGSDDRSG
jgi:hypothetical protein